MRKAVVKEVGSKKMIARDEKEWIKIPNQHPAIIDEDTFKKANSLIKRWKSPKRVDKIPYLLKKKIFCGICKHSLSRKNNLKKSYICRYSNIITEFECNNLTIFETEIEDAIYNTLKIQAKLILSEDYKFD